MLSSIIFGPESLFIAEQKKEISLTNGKKKIKTFKVIDHKKNLSTMKIGHSKYASETFFPHFVMKNESGEIFADIAGFQDTNGDIIEFINCLINKSIFNRAKSVRFKFSYLV